jgi:hypothetical protein
VFVGSLSVFGCGDGGSGGGDPNELCDTGLCAQSAALKEQCVDAVAACQSEPDSNQDECAIFIDQICEG